MKKILLTITSLACQLFLQSAYAKKDSSNADRLRQTDIEIVYSHYLQDGDHSAITGGIGTEKLTVYAPNISIKHSAEKHSYGLKFGADVITSASTDNIDFIVSSASRTDMRSYAGLNYSRFIGKQGWSIFGGLGFSMESDYFSIGSKIGFLKEDKTRLASYGLQFQMYNDDLRWGRLSADYIKPVNLIYPAELRYKEWYDVYKRNSYNLKLAYTKAINMRNTLGVFPEFTFQEGLLATPFHRIYFSDGALGVEQLPKQRLKAALALRLHTFVRGNVILKNAVNTYVDNFGIKAFSIENESAIKLNPVFTLYPNARWYWQSGSKYFAPYKMHRSTEQYFTSDYDLSRFYTLDFGVGFKYAPRAYFTKRWMFDNAIFRYNYLMRKDGLSAHTFSLVLQTSRIKK